MTEGDSLEDEMDPLDELSSIVRDLKAHLIWQTELGGHGLPRDPDLQRRLAESPLPDLSRSGSVESAAASKREPERSLDTSAPLPGLRNPQEFAAPKFDEDTPKRPSTPLSRRPPPSPQKKDRTHLVALGDSLDEVNANVRTCQKCDLHTERTQTVFSRGTGSSGLCFVGEGPGAEEDAQGKPFVGPAGQLLDKMLVAMGLSPEEVYICNVVKCRPPNNRRPTPPEMSSCAPYLERQLELLNPQVIVALGGTAVLGLLGITDGITRVRGKFRLYEGRIAVMPTFHPAYLLRNPAAKRQVWTDLRQVLAHLGRELPTKI
jgi:DNA polymerase